MKRATGATAGHGHHSRDQELAGIVAENIDALLDSRRQFERQKPAQDRWADVITCFAGSMVFVYLHALWFGAWIAVNLGWTPVAAFDDFPFGLLTMVVSLEAIFLSTFVLVSQNRMQVLADRRSDLDLHINLLAEHEVTRLLAGVHAIADHLGVQLDTNGDMASLERDTSPKAVMDAIERQEEGGELEPPEVTDQARPRFGQRGAQG
ncbi:MAG: DUF1003 domain-containing protein [Dehalococcoidia bacterium]|nr:DUF1003 domain-containing protein [Dehalococcoidia bacterium]